MKILIIRFSSIGDIVLTTPVVRAVKQQVPGAVIHYVTKRGFKSMVSHNPNIEKVFTIRKSVREVAPELKKEKYDLVIDLHKNLRSRLLRSLLGVKAYSFDKLNLQKFLAVNFKMRRALPDKHIVDRYMDGLKKLGVKNDNNGLDYFIGADDHVDTAALFFKNKPVRFIALVIGGSYNTKKIPLAKLEEICLKSRMPIVMLGGKKDKPVADELRKKFPHLANCSGVFTINQSASVISQSEWVITSDTGMMHIATAYNKKTISVWGNTIPEFGMAPYLPRAENRIVEVNGLRCRPCSKLGFSQCPRGHFKCMNEIDYGFVSELE